MAEPIVESAELQVVEEQAGAQLVLHCEPGEAAQLGAAAGVALPPAMLRLVETGAWRALHLAPDEWLLIGPLGEREAMIARIGAATSPHSLVDVSERTRHLRISGRSAAPLIGSGCPLDLAPHVFTAGSCTRTLFGKAPVLIERESDGFRMHFARSFGHYVIELARSAALDLPRTQANWGVTG